MKVCTDACLFGSWVASKMNDAQSILDIGSGTGLLMMMLAQKMKASIDGIEIDKECYSQLQENITQNEWKERFRIFHGDARSFQFDKKYDLIISNPPFFENDLLSESQSEQVAKHSTSFSFNDLLSVADSFLTTGGKLAVLLPYHRYEAFVKLAIQKHFFVRHVMLVRQTLKHDFFRAMLILDGKEDQCIEEEMSIRGKNEYSEAFIKLMSEYYLSL